MSTDPASTYDEIPYSDHSFPYTHPDHLATLGAIHGLACPPVDRCRVLELGCAGGGNLIPMALESPEARFVGIDLSTRQIDSGKALVAELGLTNLALHAMSISDVDDGFGMFDYIICHGVFSWVPEPVRDRILEICAGRLNPGGVAYVSYNTYPGWHARGLVRDMLAFHVRSARTALDRVERARDFLEEITRVLPDKSSAYARILATERQFLRGVGNSYIYHEHLEETNHPFYFQQFMAQAEARGLTFLSEARMPGLIDTLPSESKAQIEGWAEDELGREQYLDFVCNRTFRRTLLCHEGEARRAEPYVEALRSMWVSTSLTPVSDAPNVTSSAAEEFHKADGEARLSTNNPIVKCALALLHEIRPDAISMEALWEGVRERLGDAVELDSGPAPLHGAMLRCFRSNLVELHVRPPRFARGVPDRPHAAPLARIQAREGVRVTNLRRRTVELAEFDRLVLDLLDGTRDLNALLDAMMARIRSGEFSLYDGEQPIEDLERVRTMIEGELGPSLARLANLALLRQRDQEECVV